MKSYADKLLDPKWQKVRLKIFERDLFTCLDCGSESKTLHLHHVYYVSGREPWEYPDSAFRTLCKKCHDEVKLESPANKYDWETFIGWSFRFKSSTGYEIDLCDFASFAHDSDLLPENVFYLVSEGMRRGLLTKEMILEWGKK